jgi:hypothetical protein
MPVTTRQQLKMQANQSNHASQSEHNNRNHANIDFEDASKEWRKNKIKHENCHFTYTRNHK